MKSTTQELSSQYNPREVEDKIYRIWEGSGYFNPDKLPKYKTRPTGHKTYCITVPPPNITGSLHMGHALNATIQDILIRKKRMEGYKTLWLPGTDHAGIATNSVVEKELKKQGISRFDLGREKFIEKVWEWKEKYGHIILDQFKKLGSSMDWSRTRFTMDQEYQTAVITAFSHYYEKGWIYRGERTVNWCIRCYTTLSDLEVEYITEDAKMYYIKYGPLTIATVRPETKLGDTAIAVNPKDERYKKYIGEELGIQTVLGPAKMKVIGDEEVDMTFGTGVMKVTPAHDMHDFELSLKHNLEKKQVIGPDGKMTELTGKYKGLSALQARNEIVEDMKKIGILEKVEPYIHNIARCYRCNTVLEPILSIQWFLKMTGLAKQAVGAIKTGKIKFHPKRWEKVYLDWLSRVRDWPISRQTWWGHQLPIFCCKKSEEAKIKNLKSKSDNEYCFVATQKPAKCPICKECDMEQVLDTLDTWFSSALWPLATLGWPSSVKTMAGEPFVYGQNQKLTFESRALGRGKIKNQNLGKPLPGSDLARFYPTSVLSTARDIINLWVARMVFSGFEFMGQEPFKNVIIHATILTKDGKRMSKSLGTGIDPVDLIVKYGADATRFGLIWQAMGNQDIHWSEEHVVAGKKFCNKLWNAARFVLMRTFGENHKAQNTNYKQNIKPKTQTAADKKILNALAKTKKGVSAQIEKYEFGQALHTIYDFFWHEFCDKYIEVSKSQITNHKLQKPTKHILLYVLAESLKLLHPFMPYVTENIWTHLPIKNKKMLIVETWPK